MAEKISKKIAVLATDGFEQAELTEPVQALRAAGAEVDIISLNTGEIQGMKHHDKGDKTKVDLALSEAHPEQYDALLLPGGVANPDTLRADKHAVAFVQHFVNTRKPIAAICHGPWTLIETDLLRGKRVTSWPSLKTDLKNAGAEWVDQEVVVDETLVTSRNPDDIPAFNRAFLELLAHGQAKQAA
jgi:protease I